MSLDKLTERESDCVADIVEAVGLWLQRQLSRKTTTEDDRIEAVAATAAAVLSSALPPQEDGGKALGLMCRGAARVKLGMK